MSVQGTVCGHEQHVVQHLRKILASDGVALEVLPGHISYADIYILFHRTKQRLPQDELNAMLAPFTGTAHSRACNPQQEKHVNYY